MNVGILFSDFGPYHAARIEALSDELSARDGKLFAYRFSETSDLYGWKPANPKDVEVITLVSEPPTNLMAAYRTAKTFRRKLSERQVETVFLPTYSPLPNLLCLFGAKLAGCKTILMNESWYGTEKAGVLGRAAKHLLVRLFDAALVGGTRQREYACGYGQPRSKVFLGYDAVDGKYYAREAERWRGVPAAELPVANLPARYFLNLGRFIPKKNIETLIRAYAQFAQKHPSNAIALVLVGEGSETDKFRELAAEHNLPVRDGLDSESKPTDKSEIVFYPFQQVDTTPLFFARCEAFVLPSLYEEWGLVVNEAMACGAAVIVSENVGCAPDLVVEGENGFQFDPREVNQLAVLLEKFSDDPALARRLGTAGAEHINNWGPERFAEGALNALNSTV